MELLPDGLVSHQLTREDFDADGNLIDTQSEISLVVKSAEIAANWIGNNDWSLLWRDCDVLYQSPRPLEVYENTYILAPNVQRFTIGKILNAVVPNMKKGLFYTDPPFLMRPRPGTSQDIVLAKTGVFRFLLDKMQFKRETGLALEQFALMGTGIVKWGVDIREECDYKRKSSIQNIPVGDMGATARIAKEETPQITEVKKIVTRPWVLFKDIRNVFVSPNLKVPDIRQADYVIDQTYMDFYQLNALKNDPRYQIPENLIDLFFSPAESNTTPGKPPAEQNSSPNSGMIHHGADDTDQNSGDPLMKKLEVLEYQDRNRVITVLNRTHCIRSEENEFHCITYLSANWWNRPKAFWGIGLGQLLSGNQRVDQGTINAILKMLSFGTNPSYLKSADSGAITQMMRTGLGKIQLVNGDVDKAYKLLETPRVPAEVWTALRESEQSSETTSGADAALIQGTTGRPGNGMGRSAAGANILAGANASRLEGPLDHFIDGIFEPFLYILDDLVFRFMPDHEILEVAGQELGRNLINTMDMQEYHDGKVSISVLAGAYASARQTMVQSLTILSQILENPQLQSFLAEVHGEFIDLKTLAKMYIEASQWGDTQDLIRPLTPEMKKNLQAKQQAALQAPIQGKAILQQQKFAQEQELENQKMDNRIKRDITIEAFRASSGHEAVTGEPAEGGAFGGENETPAGA
jgi:hypothetical protein